MLTSQNIEPAEKKPFILFRPVIGVWRWLFPPSQADKDRQSSTTRLTARISIFAICIGVAVAAAYYAKPIDDFVDTWRSNRKVSQAEELEQGGKVVEAWRVATEAYHLDPDNPKAIRMLARYYILARQKDAGYLLQKLRRLGHFSEDDLELEISALANASNNKAASDKIEELLRDSKPSRRVVDIADRVMQQIGRNAQLLIILKSYVEQSPEDMDIRLLYAQRRIQFGNPLESREGMADVWELAAKPEEVGLRALDYLNAVTNFSSDDQRRLVELLQNHPLAKEDHRIAALKRLVALEPARRQEILDKAVEERRKLSREQLAPIARWLSLEGEYDRFFSLFNEDMVRDAPLLLGHYLNALMLMKRHEEMARLINNPSTRLMSHERAFYTAHLAFATGKSWDEVNTLLFRALTSAEQYGRADQVLRIAQYADQRNHPLVAEQAYQSASASTRSEKIQRLAFEGLLRLTYRNGNSKGYMEACHDSTVRWPENNEFRELSLYASLLSGMDLETSIPAAQKLLDDRPDDSRRKVLVALGHYRMLDFPSALKTLLPLKSIDSSQISTGQLAVICGILKAAGMEQYAKTLEQQIPEDRLMLREETHFLLIVNPARLVPAIPEPEVAAP